MQRPRQVLSRTFPQSSTARSPLAQVPCTLSDLRSQGARRAYVEMNDANTAGLALCGSSGFEPEGDIALVKELHG